MHGVVPGKNRTETKAKSFKSRRKGRKRKRREDVGVISKK